jgi:lipid-binding SYLF domain-containing protein
VKIVLPTLLAISALIALPAGPLRAADRDWATVASAAEVLQSLSAVPLSGIPRALLQDAQGIVIVPDVIKAGFVVGGRHGRGVALVRCPSGAWGNPVFVGLTGGSIGWQIGIQATDVVLVFRTRKGLDRILEGKGKLTLGADVAVAAGPVGRQAEADTDGRLRAEIYSYSRSRGLFAGLSVEGASLRSDCGANAAFYGVAGGRPADVQVITVAPVPAAAEKLKAVVTALSAPPAPPTTYPPRIVPVPVAPPPAGPSPTLLPPPPP